MEQQRARSNDDGAGNWARNCHTGCGARGHRPAYTDSMRHQGIKILVEEQVGVKPIDYRSVAADFAEDIAPTDVLRWADQVHAAVAAARRRRPLREILAERPENEMARCRRELQQQIADLQRQLLELSEK